MHLEIPGLELKVQRTRHLVHAGELVRGELFCGDDTVLVGGGDVTIHEVVDALMEFEPTKRPALAMLPGGTGKRLVHDLGLVDVEHAREALLNPRRQAMDLLKVVMSRRLLYTFNMWGGVFRLPPGKERKRYAGWNPTATR